MLKSVFTSRGVGVGVLVPLLLLIGSIGLDAADPEAVRGTGGAVSSAVPSATTAGLEILGAGGNAVDAAVATALALAVVHPQAGNLGGGGFAVVRVKDRVETLDFRETAPAGASENMFLDSRGEPKPEASLIGPLAAGVPGSPTGLYDLHQRHGRLPWPEVVAPAIRLARDGFVVTRRLEEAVAGSADLLRRFPETEAVWFPGGKPPVAGEVMRLPELAATLEAYAARGATAITEGPIAASVELAARRHGGIIRAADLTAYRAVWRMPIRFEAFGWQVASMPLPSSGGIILAETFGMLERLGWAETPRFGADRYHLLAEVWRRAYADRYSARRSPHQQGERAAAPRPGVARSPGRRDRPAIASTRARLAGSRTGDEPVRPPTSRWSMATATRCR